MKLLFFLISITVLLNASSLKLLGLGDSHNKKEIIQEMNNSIAWSLKGDTWSVSKPLSQINIKDYKNGYILLNNDTVDYKVQGTNQEYYEIKKGWNYLASSINGVDVLESFKNEKAIEFVYVYDKRSEAWAGFSPDKGLLQKMLDTRILLLKYIEENIGFYVYALEDTKVKIQSSHINKQCQKKIDEGYGYLIDSGRDNDMTYDDSKTIGIASRYASHYRSGIYNDSRVAIIYEKIKPTTKELLKYGIVSPKVMFKYLKEREDSFFLVYDYLFKECYLGAFPSKKVPPFSSLKKIK